MRARRDLLALVLLSSLTTGGSCGGSSSSGEKTGTPPANDPYAAVPAQDLPLRILADLTTIPGPPSGTTCAPDESHCAHIYVFDKAGLLIAEQYRSFGLEPTETHVLTYDANGRLHQIAYSMTTPFTPESVETYEYDGQGRVTRRSEQWATGTRVIAYVYSGDTAAVTATTRNASGAITYSASYTYTYDAAGQLVTTVSTVGGTTNYTYANGLRTDLRNTGTNGRLYHVHYAYNAQRNLIRVETDFAPADGIVDEARIYTYRTLDVTHDGTIDVNIGYSIVAPRDTAVGASDGTYQSPSYDTSGGLNWGGHDTGTCSTCGDMQGQINKIILGY